MPFKKFFLYDSDIDEVSFVMELTSILQIRFNQKISLQIQTDKNFLELIDQFQWSIKPVLTNAEIEDEETLIELFSDSRSHETMIVSSDHSEKGGKAFSIPSHLLKSEKTSREIRTSMAYVVAQCIAEEKFSFDKPSKKISLIHMDDIREWISLVEASEALYAYWYRQRSVDTELELVGISPDTLNSVARRVSMTSDYVVILKITQLTSQFIKLVRTYNPKAKFAFHAFESATVFFANTSLYKLDQFLFEEDLWLMSCEEDKALAKKSWKKINAEVVPLRLPESHLKSPKELRGKDLLYFGRISEQKNLHDSILAVSFIAEKLRSEGRKFKIFGYEDFLGVPNLRIPSLGYLEYIYRLAQSLHIEDIVEFHQAVPEKILNEELKKGIFFSLSVHSDENFGLVAFRALNNGSPAVLSNWGGHRDLGKYFNNVQLVTVYETKNGPRINPHEVSKILLKVLSDESKITKNEIDSFSFKEIAAPVVNMTPSDLKIQVTKKVENSFPLPFRKWPLYGKIFKNYQDEKFLISMREYGAVKPTEPKPEATFLLPMVSLRDKEIKISDCRAGVLRYPRNEDKKLIQVKQLGNDSSVLISFPEWKWLWENGYALKGEI